MNTTPTPTAAPAAKAISRRLPSANDETCNHQSSATPRDNRYTFQDGKAIFYRDDQPRMLPGIVTVPVGPVQFELRGVVGPLLHPRDNGPSNGLCFPDQLVIFISFDNPPSTRLLIAWHELAHAAHSVYNVGDREKLDEESSCDLVGAFMAGISPEKYAEIVAFVTEGRA